MNSSSEGEELVDQPQIERGKLRVSGPFTVEAVQPAEELLDTESPIGGEPMEDALETFDPVGETSRSLHPAAPNAEAYLTQMLRLLRQDGVRFPNNQTMQFATLDALEGGILHAEGRWEGNGTECCGDFWAAARTGDSTASEPLLTHCCAARL